MIGILDKIKNKAKNNQGMTLIEVVTAVSIFAIIMVIAIDSFLAVIRVNRESSQQQALQDHTRFLYDMMAKEIRMARVVDSPHCATISGLSMYGHVYGLSSDSQQLVFKNYHNQCVSYTFNDAEKTLNITRRDEGEDNSVSALVMPSDVSVEEAYFEITDLDTDSAESYPPSVTLFMKLKNDIWDPATIVLQTTVTSRYIQ